MKRILTFVLIFVMLLSCCITASAAAPSLTMTAENPQPGGKLTITFGVEAGANINSAKFVVSYDTATFQYVSDSYEQGDLLSNFINDHNCLNGQVLVAAAGIEPIVEQGTLFTLTFLVDSNAKDTKSFYFYAEGCTDIDGKEVTVKEASLEITPTGTPITGTDVTPVTSVDANGKTYTVGATSSGKTKTSEVLSWVIAIVAVIVIVGLAVLIVWLLLNRKKKEVVVEANHKSILDEDAKDLLSLTNNDQQEE